MEGKQSKPFIDNKEIIADTKCFTYGNFSVNTYISLKHKRFIKFDLEKKLGQEFPRYLATKAKPHLLIYSVRLFYSIRIQVG